MFPMFPKIIIIKNKYKYIHYGEQTFFLLGTLGTWLKPLENQGFFCSQGFSIVWEHFGNIKEDLYVFLLCQMARVRGDGASEK